MVKDEDDTTQIGWRLLDEVVAAASTPRHTNPWVSTGSATGPRFVPDFGTLQRLLAVPTLLESKSQTGLPALAIDIWVAYELRRAGFDADSVWPRQRSPRIQPTPVTQLLKSLPIAERRLVEARLASSNANGAVGASARVLGKHYFKQVDVVMSAWETGPELLISTKRMDKSFNRNAANRVEESYGDAKNLRLRHPMAAMGFVYALNADAFRTKRDKAEWLLDLLAKLGREADAYDAVLLVVPNYEGLEAPALEDGEDGDALTDAGLEDDTDESVTAPSTDTGVTADTPRLEDLPLVGLLHDEVPEELSASRFFETIVRLVLDRTPITQHKAARERLDV